MESKIDYITSEKLKWIFRSNSEPTFDYGGGQVNLDPFPAYRHDERAIRTTLANVKAICPPITDITYWISDFEEVSRSNAHSNRSYDYDSYNSETRKYTRWTSHVFMGAKRIMPHPAHTRALTAHEYGHHVEWWLEKILDTEYDGVIKEYADIRGVTFIDHGHGGIWHKATPEIFADDFRILVAGIELEYWPHPGIEYPKKDSKYGEWWKEKLELLQTYEKDNTRSSTKTS